MKPNSKKQGQNKFNPEYYFVSVFPLPSSSRHVLSTMLIGNCKKSPIKLKL